MLGGASPRVRLPAAISCFRGICTSQTKLRGGANLWKSLRNLTTCPREEWLDEVETAPIPWRAANIFSLAASDENRLGAGTVRNRTYRELKQRLEEIKWKGQAHARSEFLVHSGSSSNTIRLAVLNRSRRRALWLLVPLPAVPLHARQTESESSRLR